MRAVTPTSTPAAARENIKTIVRLEEEAHHRRSTADRVADVIASFVGSVPFVLIHLVWFAFWALLNLGVIGGALKFDPYPFALLCMLVSLEGVLLSTFVLIKQNRMSQRADQRAHLDLQINLLTEKEVTKLLQLQQMICDHLGIKGIDLDQETQELSNNTAVDNLARELEQKLPAME